MKFLTKKTLSTFSQYFIFFSLLSCGGNDDPTTTTNEPDLYKYEVPENTGDGWRTSSLNDVGISISLIEKMINDQDLRKSGFNSVVIIKDNLLVFEKYWPGRESDNTFVNFGKDDIHETHSVSKSITSLIMGLAISQDHINSVDNPIKNYLPEFSAEFDDPEKSNITIKNTLTMQAGIEWDEWSRPYTDFRNSHVAMNSSGSPIQYVLSRAMAEAPGNSFVYNSGLTLVAGKIIENATGQDLAEYTKTHLFAPLDIDNFYWYKYPDGTYQTGGGISLRPRDMAKFGQLILDNGIWNGNQVIDASWVAQSIEQRVDFPPDWNDDHYGYFWWMQDFDVNGETLESIHASGYGGQHIYAFPSHNLTVVFTAGNYDTPTDIDQNDLMLRYILPALN